MNAWHVAGLLKVTASYLAERGSTSPRLDAELLLAEALGVSRVDLYTQHDRPVSSDELGAYRALVARRGRREPVAYILGRASFRYVALRVTPATLIPRPETEELVSLVLAWLREHGHIERAAAAEAPLIVDVGTGSGAIAVSLASEAGVKVRAVDISTEALEIATENAEAAGVADRLEFSQSDLLTGAPPASLLAVVSNPPYVSAEEHAKLEPDVRSYEPRLALVGGEDGLDVIRRLLPQAAAALAPGGAAFLEVGERQADIVAGLAREAGFASAAVESDMSAKRRFVRAQMRE